MTRFFSPLVAFFLLLVVPCLVSAYSIELPAAAKECFFEDLHTNDKVRGKQAPVLSIQTLNSRSQMTVTYQAGGGGHMDIDFWVREFFAPLKRRAAYHPAADRSGWPRTAQGRQAVNRNCFNYCKKGREARILFLESHELGLGQGRQV